MTPTNSIRSELAAAIRRVNVAYRSIPDDRRPDVRWDSSDDALELALKVDDRVEAMRSIREWESHWIDLFREVQA